MNAPRQDDFVKPFNGNKKGALPGHLQARLKPVQHGGFNDGGFFTKFSAVMEKDSGISKPMAPAHCLSFAVETPERKPEKNWEDNDNQNSYSPK